MRRSGARGGRSPLRPASGCGGHTRQPCKSAPRAHPRRASRAPSKPELPDESELTRIERVVPAQRIGETQHAADMNAAIDGEEHAPFEGDLEGPTKMVERPLDAGSYERRDR